jgi:MFS family permease
MDQRLFVLARESALKELLRTDAAAIAQLKTYIGYATTAMILGWATGGIFFGMMSDKWGRVKTMVSRCWCTPVSRVCVVSLRVGGFHDLPFS